MDGFFLIDKPKGWTSFDLVRKVRGIVGVKKVGHSGTLDPLATGLMLLAVGQGTKLLEYLIGCDKEYEVLAKFGAVSDTYDAEGVISESAVGDLKELGLGDLHGVIESDFLGEIKQFPPKYSALKIGGRRACDIVRAGGEVEMSLRPVRIDEFEVLKFQWPKVSFRVSCSSGTYIRSLVHDLGAALGVGAYVEELKRNKIGEFDVAQSCSLEDLGVDFEKHLLPMEKVARGFPYTDLSDEEFEGMKDGRIFPSNKIEQEVAKMAFYKEKFVGVVEGVLGGVKYKKLIV